MDSIVDNITLLLREYPGLFAVWIVLIYSFYKTTMNERTIVGAFIAVSIFMFAFMLHFYSVLKMKIVNDTMQMKIERIEKTLQDLNISASSNFKKEIAIKKLENLKNSL